MSEKYYFDTCIWRDFYESRTGLKRKPLGKYAANIFMKIIKRKDTLFYSDLIIRELKKDYNENEVNDMLNFLFLTNTLKKVEMKKEDYLEARKIAEERNLPIPDAFHAILARNNKAIMISQDAHLQELKDIVKVKKPEEID